MAEVLRQWVPDHRITGSGPLRLDRLVPHRRTLAGPDRVRRQAAILVLAATVYFGGRVVVEGSATTSTTNASRLIGVERALGIDVEPAIQRVVVDVDLLRTIGNWVYVWLHWPLLVFVVALLLWRRDPGFEPLRDALIVSAAVGLVLFAVFPVAPPRFMPGFEGTVSQTARTYHLDIPLSWTNRFAAFPSYHVGWTAIACLALSSHVRHRLARLAAVLPAVLMAFAVISTGNHYVLDTLAGAAIAGGLYTYFVRRTPSTACE